MEHSFSIQSHSAQIPLEDGLGGEFALSENGLWMSLAPKYILRTVLDP